MFGYHSYANIQLPKNITREELYKSMLYEQEKEFKKEILEYLECSDEEFEYYQERIHNIHKEYEKKIIDNTDHMYSVENIRQDLLDALQKVFPNRDYDYVKIIFSKNSHKFGSFLGKSLEDKYIVGISFYDTATLYIDKIHYKTKNMNHYKINCLEILCHELSHIYHKDRVFMAIINNLLLIRENKRQITFETPAFIDLPNGIIRSQIKCYQEKDISRDQIKKARDLYEEWLTFIEIRSDLESMFVMKETEEFKKLFVPKFNGYPTSYDFLILYENHFPVSYRQDFLKGIENDSKLHMEQQIML
jgi:hypothetical protein